MISRSSARVVIDVLATLLRREWRQRLSRGRWLTAWTLIEPLVQIFAVGLIYTTLAGGALGQSAFLFLGIGIFGYVSFRNMCNRPSDAIISSAGLMTYRQVQAMDLIFAKWCAEAITYTLLGALGIVYLLSTEQDVVVRPGRLLFAGALSLTLSLSATCGLAYLRKRWPPVTNYFRPVFFILYVTSGALHPIWALPESVADVLQWNPLAQIVEILRESLLFNYQTQLTIRPFYLVCCAATALMLTTGIVIRRGDYLRAK